MTSCPFLLKYQDDFLDCFGDPEVIGKIGTDIQDKKCSWMLAKALEVANASQRDYLKVQLVSSALT